MGDKTKIEWTDATWNPTVGCSVVSPGCTNCYAMKMAGRLEAMGQPIYQGLTQRTKAGAVWTGKVELSNWGQVIKPLSWKRPRRIFVNSMSDLFHEALPDEAIDQVFAVMGACDGNRSSGLHHTFQVLTKRPESMRSYLLDPETPFRIGAENCKRFVGFIPHKLGVDWAAWTPWPLPNVWLGVSVEDQERADERIPLLLDTPAAVRFISAEPLLGPVDLKLTDECYCDFASREFFGSGERRHAPPCPMAGKLDWVIVGGESGPGARPCHIDWVRSIVAQCKAAEVPCFVKQLGAKAQSRFADCMFIGDRKGGNWDEWPADLRVREFPR